MLQLTEPGTVRDADAFRAAMPFRAVAPVTRSFGALVPATA